LAEEPEGFRHIISGRASQHARLGFRALNAARSFSHTVLLTIAQDCFFEILDPLLNGPQAVLNGFGKNTCSTINVSVTGFGTHHSLHFNTLTKVVLKPVKGCWEHDERNWVTLVS
jgi:secreted Zn-dependent insulinase-like peptidase